MAEKVVKTRIQQKHDIEANWNKATNFVPLQGEIIVYDVDEKHSYERSKIGDGVTTVALLPFTDEANFTTQVTDDDDGNVVFTNLVVEGAIGLDETDPTVPAWAKEPSKPTYTAEEVGALPNTTVIPGSLADLTDDATHRTVTDADMATWNAKSDFSGSYNDLSNKPTIPSIDGLATETYVNDKVASMVDSAPETLDTLNELAAALGDDPNFATTIATQIGGKANAEHTHTKSEITDFPTSMPASDVSAWAKASTKPSYTATEVGAAPADIKTINTPQMNYVDVLATAEDLSICPLNSTTFLRMYHPSNAPIASGDFYVTVKRLNVTPYINVIAEQAGTGRTWFNSKSDIWSSWIETTVTTSQVDGKVAKVASTDNAITRFNGTTGDVQNSKAYIDDNGNLTLDGTTIKINGGMTQVASPTVIPAFINGQSADGLGWTNASNLSVGSATKATQDASGNTITSTYATKTELNTVKATIPSAYTHPTSHPASMITGLATVATSGSYNDLSNKPTIPTVNNATLTIQKNGTNVATFTANSSSNATANITVPTGAAADKGVDTSIAAASTSTNLPTSKAVAAFVEGKGYKTTDNNTTYTFATGDSNGQIKVTPSGGSAQNVSVKGLGSAAYTASTAYAAASHGTHVSYSSTAPVMDGTASVGSASTVARSDHKHPTDTSRAPAYQYSTTDLTAGSSALTTGTLYFVYE